MALSSSIRGVAEQIRVARSDVDLPGDVLTSAAVHFVATLAREFAPRIEALLAAREIRRMAWKAGDRLDFEPETAAIRDTEWRVGPIPRDLRRRIVEITGPVDRKMIINALNSGADVFMADFEDANSPTWRNVVQGQANLMDAVRATISYEDPASGKRYTLAEKTATLLVRPRGLHLPEAHFIVDEQAVPAALFDFGLFFFHNARELIERGTGPYFYLPKLEHASEAALWNDVFLFAQKALGIPRGTIKATVLIETLPAAFQMDEILHALREHIVGLNCGRWDYIFSTIKTRRWDPNAVMPDRSQVTMAQPAMRAYTQLLVKTCHRRGAYAMGGMAAQIPVKNDERANEAAFEKVRADKIREVTDGHDGTWVAHPGLVPVARDAFASRMSGDHQLDRRREDVTVTAGDLLQVPTGSITAEGVRLNVRIGMQYIEAWLRGSGAVPLYNLMEDAATAEISRTQLWQWIRHRASMETGQRVTRELVESIIGDEFTRLTSNDGRADSRLTEARDLLTQSVFRDELDEFLTLVAYPMLADDGSRIRIT